MKVKELAELLAVDKTTIRKWCHNENETRSKKNKIKQEPGANNMLEYDLTEADILKFKNRKKAGWQKGKPRKQPVEP
jgi:transposase